MRPARAALRRLRLPSFDFAVCFHLSARLSFLRSVLDALLCGLALLLEHLLRRLAACEAARRLASASEKSVEESHLALLLVGRPSIEHGHEKRQIRATFRSSGPGARNLTPAPTGVKWVPPTLVRGRRDP